MVELRALGRAEIHTASATLTPSQSIAFPAGIYLIMERGVRVSRTHLASLLWPGANRPAQTHRLRQTVYQLKNLGVPLRSSRDFIELPRNEVRTDIDKLSESRLSAAGTDATFEFLPGYDPRVSEEFQDWLDRTRENVHSALTRALVAELREARNSGSWTDVERIAGHCLRIDPYNEAAVLAAAEAYAMRGQKAMAVSILDRYVQDLAPSNARLILPASVLRRRVLQDGDTATISQSAAAEPNFVGRGEEMARLTRLLQFARAGTGSGCLVDGEPGIGKTRISSELAKFAKLQGVAVERVACKRSDPDQPLSVFLTLIPRLRELPGALGCARTSLLWLKRLTDFDTPSQDLPMQSDDPSALYMNLRSAVFDLLDAVSDERCLLVIVEDVQWLDRASARLLAAILDRVSPKKILFLFNSRENDNPLTEAVSANQLSVIHLKPLADDDAKVLVRRVMADVNDGFEADGPAWLINAGEGNPYFLQELTKHWVESGQRQDLPPSVAAVLSERLCTLSVVARQLLQVCAVLAENSNFERLELILGYAPNDLLSGIQELSTSGMLKSAPSGEECRQPIVVRHDLLSIEVLKTLAPTARAFIHRRCGFVLEQEALRTSSISLMRACAFHWDRSGDSERAYDLAVKCADHLLEIGLAAEAARAFESALGFCATVERRLEVLGRMIQAHRMTRDCSALLNAIARFRSAEDGATPTVHHDDTEIIEFEALRTAEIELGFLFKRTLACVYDTCLPAAHRVKAAGVAVKLASSIPDLGELTRVYQTVRPVLDDASVGVRFRLQLQVIYNTMCGDLQKALQFAKERVTFERAEGTTWTLVNAMTDLAFVLRRTGPSHEMLDTLREAYKTAIEHKHFAAARDCACKLGSMLEDEEDPASEEWMAVAMETSRDSPDVHSNFSFNADSIRIAIRANRLDDARRMLEHELDWEWLRQRRLWLTAAVALRIRLMIAERASADSISKDVEELGSLYRYTAGLGRQDYEVAALVNGLIYIKEIERAKFYLRDYLSRGRRDLTPPSNELVSISRALKPTAETVQMALAVGSPV